ncbi:MAG: NAD(P)-dependent dehydrogenase, short-chain alcohol dehydrogenase family [Pelagibacterales bacterium]|nr:NAD(P)-dependent dehydrogenase, short-chain alcohol dehydrogenase family [Pelagibacterales bacterium]
MKKKYIIFGATGSIGSSLANQLYEDKMDCHLVARNEEELKKISNKLSYSYSVCDVLKLDFASDLKKDLDETQILGIAYCIGSIDIKPFKLTKSSDFVSSYVLNFVAATDVIRAFQDNLKNNKGSVVLFSTVAAKKGFVNHSIISSAKAAVEGLTVALAAELAPNIRINCIAPSLTKSKMASSIIKNTAIEQSIAKMHPLKRLGEGADSANLANFLLTPKSSWITGQIIAVDGGRSNIA